MLTPTAGCTASSGKMANTLPIWLQLWGTSKLHVLYMYIISSDGSAHMNHPHTLTLASVYTDAFFTYMNKHTHKLILVTKYN